MLVYWLTLFATVAFAIAAENIHLRKAHRAKLLVSGNEEGRAKKSDGLRIGLICASAMVFILVSGLRYGVGQDYFYTYVPFFNQVLLNGTPRDIEIGYYALNYVIAQFFDNPQPVFFVMSIIFFVFSYLGIYRLSPDAPYSIFLIIGMCFFFNFMNVMRQMTASAILLFGMYYAFKRKPLPFIVCVIAASLFHQSSLLFIVVYFFPKVKFKLWGTLAVVAILVVFNAQISNLITSIILKTTYADYVGSIFDTGSTGFVIPLMNLAILLFAGLFYYSGGNKREEEKYNLFYNTQSIAVIVIMLFGSVVNMSRVYLLFAFPGIILIPLAANNIKDRRARFLVKAAIVLLYTLYFAITVGLWNSNKVLPYVSVLGL